VWISAEGGKGEIGEREMDYRDRALSSDMPITHTPILRKDKKMKRKGSVQRKDGRTSCGSHVTHGGGDSVSPYRMSSSGLSHVDIYRRVEGF
jgi:hypothetical protein